MTVRALVLATLLAVTGCATAPKNPQQAGYALRTEYAAALDAADQYGRLPFCAGPATPGPVVCADRSVVIKIKAAKDIAKPAVEAAEAAVRSPDFNRSTYDAVLIAAQKAVIALGQIVPQLPKEPHP